MLTWVARYALFSLGAPIENRIMIILGVAIHGICYDFFFVTGQIYTDKKAADPIRAQAQGLLVMLTLGIGMFVGAKAAAYVESTCTPPESIAAQKNGQVLASRIQEIDDKLKVLEGGAAAQLTPADRQSLETEKEQLTEEKKDQRMVELRSINWKKLWAIPCIFAAVVMGFFLVFFKDDSLDSTSSDDGDEKSSDPPQQDFPDDDDGRYDDYDLGDGADE
jgi:uncharacterized integral membrane protein